MDEDGGKLHQWRISVKGIRQWLKHLIKVSEDFVFKKVMFLTFGR